MREWAR